MVMPMYYILCYQHKGSHLGGFEVGSSASCVFLSHGRRGNLLKKRWLMEGIC